MCFRVLSCLALHFVSIQEASCMWTHRKEMFAGFKTFVDGLMTAQVTHVVCIRKAS